DDDDAVERLAAAFPEAHRCVPSSDVAMAAAHGTPAHAKPSASTGRAGGQDRGLEACRTPDAATRAEPTAQAPVALHPSFRRCVDRSEPAVLRRLTDGSGLPADVWTRPARAQGHREPLDASRADVGSRKSAPRGPGVLSVAEYGALLRFDLAESLDAISVAKSLHVPVTARHLVDFFDAVVLRPEKLHEERPVVAHRLAH